MDRDPVEFFANFYNDVKITSEKYGHEYALSFSNGQCVRFDEDKVILTSVDGATIFSSDYTDIPKISNGEELAALRKVSDIADFTLEQIIQTYQEFVPQKDFH